MKITGSFGLMPGRFIRSTAVKGPFPEFIEPMMASPAEELFDSPEWIFETKLDGFRAIAVIDSTGKARIWSRNRLPLEAKFPTIRDAVEEPKPRSTILDGEIVALDEEGIPRFQLLQKWQKRPTAPAAYVLFDLLWDNGRDLTGKSVIQRQERLEEIITPVPGIQVGGYVEQRGVALFRLAKEKGLEGIIAKRKTGIYQPGKRSADWLKIKSRPQQEFVVCGFTEGKGSRKHFGALLLGAYRNGKLRYFGHSGTGFSEKGLAEAIQRLRPFFTDKPTVENPPKIPEKIQWAEPKLVCEVAFAEWTEDEQLRQTTFLGWRDDKSPEEVVLEA
jgi:bifunctional non-homologous end joining protein LigD